MNHRDEQGIPQSLAEAARHRTVLDVGTQRVASVYAAALLNAAEKRHQAREVLEELESLVHDLFGADPQLEAYLATTAIGRDRKAAALRSAFEGRASEVFLNFLLVLNDHERLDLSRSVLFAYKELYDRRGGRILVQVRSAVPLPEDQRERLRQEIQETFHRDPVLEAQVDPELLGGLVVRVGDWMYDASVRTKVEVIRNQLIERSSYEIQSRRDRFCSADGD